MKALFKIVLLQFAREVDDSPNSMVGLKIGVSFFIVGGWKLANFKVEHCSWSSNNSE
jgi:hypothetical protein